MRKLIPQEGLVKRQDSLPHWQEGGKSYFITFNLLEGELSHAERAIVAHHVLFEHGTKHRLHIGCVMPDHVHLLMTPLFVGADWHSLESILKPMKGVSSRSINQRRGIRGNLWQDESYDRQIRNGQEWQAIWHYIFWNPIAQGLCEVDDEYEFTLIPDDLS